jgi:hypothetical protein
MIARVALFTAPGRTFPATFPTTLEAETDQTAAEAPIRVRLSNQRGPKKPAYSPRARGGGHV